MGHDVEREIRVEDLAAERPRLVRVIERLLHTFESQGKLSADVDEGLVHLERVGGDDDALDQLMGVAFNEKVVLESSRFRLVAVDHEIRDR